MANKVWLALLCVAWVVTVSANPVGASDDHEGHEAHERHLRALSTARYTRSEKRVVVPDVTLIDRAGSAVRLQSLFDVDTPVVLNFIYTSCTTICPVMTATFAQVQQRLGVDDGRVLMVSISVDPEFDTPARLANHARTFKASPRWRFLTGDRDDVIRALRGFDAWRGNKTNHVPLTMLRAGRGTPWIRLDGLTSASDLVSEVVRLTAP
jgi:protein SCO1/2